MTTITCPICNGSCTTMASFIKYATGRSGPAFANIACFHCGGAGTIPASMVEWMKRGEEIREWRKAQNIGLRAFAEKHGILPSLWAKIEGGRVDNSKWRELLQPGVVGDSENEKITPPLNWQHQTPGWSTATNKFARVLIHHSPTLADNSPWWWRVKTINVVESGKCETAEDAMMEAEKCWERIWLEVLESGESDED